MDADSLRDSEEEMAINWEMPEFVEQKRDWIWYTVILGSSLVAGFLIYYLTRDLIAPISIVLVILALVIFSFKKPKKNKYSLTSFGIQIGDRLYEYNRFKTYSLIMDSGQQALCLAVNQRFIPPLIVYLPLEVVEEVIEKINKHIAYNPSEGNALIDRLIRGLRF